MVFVVINVVVAILRCMFRAKVMCSLSPQNSQIDGVLFLLEKHPKLSVKSFK